WVTRRFALAWLRRVAQRRWNDTASTG
ncbi:MAG: hypothetical protein H6Q85_69, partial [candidate division NC10 bacterium]|nr:hypothetical protein [candidate division NC10 bacterium]